MYGRLFYKKIKNFKKHIDLAVTAYFTITVRNNIHFSKRIICVFPQIKQKGMKLSWKIINQNQTGFRISK